MKHSDSAGSIPAPSTKIYKGACSVVARLSPKQFGRVQLSSPLPNHKSVAQLASAMDSKSIDWGSNPHEPAKTNSGA